MALLGSVALLVACGSDDSSGAGGTGASSGNGGTGASAGSGAAAGSGGVAGGSGGNASGGAGSGGLGSGGTGGGATGDRYVAVNGNDSGDCSSSSSPCKTFAYAGKQMKPGEALVIGDGSYAEGIDAATFPSGTAGAFTVVRAEHDAAATVTGPLDLYKNGDHFLQLEGLRFEGPDTKAVVGGNVRFYRSTFVGGPASGNTVSLAIGSNDFQPGAWDVLCEDCILRGLGGRYSVLVYRAQNVTLRRLVARKDGGWGIGSASATQSEPEGVIMFYESQDSTCEQCVALDSLKESHSSAEGLGALIQNSHTNSHTNVKFVECYAVANAYSGIAFEGNGQVNAAAVSDSYSAQNSQNGITANVGGSIALTRIASLGNSGTGVASYGSSTVTLSDSKVQNNGGKALDGVSGSTTGAGPKSINLSAFDSGRIRDELCARASVTRGLCASQQTFQAYLQSFQ